MIQRSSLSVRGLYKWDNSLFDNMVLPADVDKDILVTNILSELGELEVLYPDSDYMKEIIGYWSQKQLPTWNKWNADLKIDYDPLNNYKKHTQHDGERNNTSTEKVKAYNEATNFVDYRQDIDNGDNSFTRDVTGNVGIRSYQSLLEEELNLRDKYNIYNLIIKDFKLRFCLLLY